MELITKKDECVISLFTSLEQTLFCIENLLGNYKPCLNGEHYLTDKELSQRLKISRRTLQDYRAQGLISYIQFGGKVLYRESDVENLLEKAYLKSWR